MPAANRPSLATRLGAAAADTTPTPPRLYAEVAVNADFPAQQTFSYAVPVALAPRARVGMAAYVPFGRLTLQGIIVETHHTPVFAEPEKIREIRSLIGDHPLIDEDRIALAKWIAHEYIAPIFDAVALFLPPGFERKPQTIVRSLVALDEIESLNLPPRLRDTLAPIAASTSILADALKATLGVTTVEPALAALEKRGLISREYTLARPRIGPKTIEFAAFAVPLDEALQRIADAEPPKRSRRAAVLQRLTQNEELPLAEAVKLAGSRANLERLVRTDTVRIENDTVALTISLAETAQQIRALTQTKRASQGELIVHALHERDEETLPQLREDLRVDTSTIRWLTDINAVTLTERAVERDPLSHFHVVRRPPAKLLAAQASAASVIAAAIEASSNPSPSGSPAIARVPSGSPAIARVSSDASLAHWPVVDQSRAVRAADQSVFLLHGVTGSGKTEVYLEALDRCIALGRRAIVLVPEIALTPQTIRRFRERFERVAVLHSGLSSGELFDQWHGIAAGKYDVVIGARSAVFAPQPDLGLIVIDEEHEWTYKQNDPVPRYDARAVAIELARRKGAAVVLGSATPDVVSYERARPQASHPLSPLWERGPGGEGYTLLSLPDRIRPVTGADGTTQPEATVSMPRVDVIDLREELHAGNRSMFGRELKAAVDTALARDEQVILFLNRRGMAGHVQCRDCGAVPQCTSCAVALTYHRQYDRLVCHQCNRRWKLPATCKQCGSPRVRLLGVGVEKVEAEAARLFPHARLLRWDRDVTKTRGSHDRILASFLAREADILIGTQMLAKGLDMPAVTLVGVINADTALHLPDFRAGERTFQLLTQVAGRAGRGERNGRVIIQTYTPDHYAIDAAARYDYEGFAAAELESRRQAGYPPYGRLVQLTLAHTNERWARDEALRLHKALNLRRSELGSTTDILGPTPAYVPRVRGRWRWHLLLRGPDPTPLIRDFILPPNWSIDVDPASLV